MAVTLVVLWYLFTTKRAARLYTISSWSMWVVEEGPHKHTPVGNKGKLRRLSLSRRGH